MSALVIEKIDGTSGSGGTVSDVYRRIIISYITWLALNGRTISKPKLKVKMQSVSDNDVRKRLLEKPRRPSFELAAKAVFRVQTGKMLLHLLTGRSRSLVQQLGKHGYRRLIA